MMPLEQSLTKHIRQSHPAFQRLERATEDILAKLKMPPLEAYAEQQQTTHRAPESIAPTTRDHSREPEPKAEHDIAGAPMEGLFEATQLNTLRARLRGDPNKRSSRRKVDSDLISQGILTLEEADEMLNLYVIHPQPGQSLTQQVQNIPDPIFVQYDHRRGSYT